MPSRLCHARRAPAQSTTTIVACMLGVLALGGTFFVDGDLRKSPPEFGVTPIHLEPIDLTDVTLSVVTDNGELLFSAEALERLGAVRMVTRTPWRDAPAQFDGVLLTDLLRQAGLEDAQVLRVTAENDYSVEISRAVWIDRPLVIATRVDGAPHERRIRGPLQLVYPMDADPTVGEHGFQSNWVWMAARIERVR